MRWVRFQGRTHHYSVASCTELIIISLFPSSLFSLSLSRLLELERLRWTQFLSLSLKLGGVVWMEISGAHHQVEKHTYDIIYGYTQVWCYVWSFLELTKSISLTDLLLLLLSIPWIYFLLCEFVGLYFCSNIEISTFTSFFPSIFPVFLFQGMFQDLRVYDL